MNRALMRTACILCASVLLYGCATPRPVIDLATRGAAATTMAEIEIQRYLAAAQDHLHARIVIVRQLSEAELAENYSDNFSKFLKERTGDTSGEDVGDLIRTLGLKRRQLREQMAGDLAKLDDLEKKTLDEAARSPTEAFSATKKAFTTLAEELSPQEWLALTAHYAKEIQGTLKKIKEDAKAAEKNAADVQSKP